MFAIKRFAAGFGAPGPKSGRGFLKGLFVIFAALVFAQIGIMNYPVDKENSGLSSTAIAVELSETEMEREIYINSYYKKYVSSMNEAENAETEEERNRLLDQANSYLNSGIEKDDTPERTGDNILSYFIATGIICEIRPDSGDLTEKVYNSGWPGLVFVHDSMLHGTTGFSKRSAIVFKNLSLYFGEKYPGIINFFVYDTSKADDYVFRGKFWPKFGIEIRKEIRKKRWDMDGVPKILMYSPFDVMEKETPFENDGIVKLIDCAPIDVWEGCPRRTPGVTHVKRSIDTFTVRWIKPNFYLGLSPKGYIYRFDNGGQAKIVGKCKY